MATTAQASLKQGLRIVDDADFPSSEGQVTQTGMHIPDLDVIDGKNILPTHAGYSSYFGIDRNIDDTVLGSLKVQEIITYRTKHGDSVQLAFTSAGLYLSSLGGSGTATRTYVAAAPPVPARVEIDLPAGTGNWIKVFWATLGHASPWELWTYVLLENELYIYHKGLKHIYKMYSVEPEQVLFDELDPTYIISTDKIWQFTINAEDDSDGDDTYKAVEFNTDSGLYLGKYKHLVDKAHQVWNAEELVLAPFHAGLNARMENLVLAKVDIDAYIPISLGYDEDDITVTHNGAPDELIIDFTTSNYVQSGAHGNQNLIFECEDLEPGGTLTFTYDGTDYDLIVPLGTTEQELVTLIVEHLEDSIPDSYAVWSYGDFLAQPVNSGEITLKIDGASTLVQADPQISPSVVYSGTATSAEFRHDDGGGLPYEPNAKINVIGHMEPLDDYATFSGGEEAWIEVQGTKYSVYATASEAATSVIDRLHAVLLAATPFVDQNPGTDSFQYSAATYWQTGGVGQLNYKASDNLAVTFSNDAANISYQLLTALTIKGFKEYGLTKLVVTVLGVDYDIPMSSVYDSNDLVPLIFTAIDTGGGIASGAAVITTPASATADYDLIVNVPIFDGSTPSPTLTQDGTTLWAVDGGATTSETIDLLQVDGIFQARGRLGYWTANNIEYDATLTQTLGWSAVNDPMDFVPSTVTRANQITIKAQSGIIMMCLGYENGFMVYSTGNVIQAQYVKDSVNVFTFNVVPEAPGLIDPRHLSSTLGSHYYWHTSGLYGLNPNSGTISEQLGEVSDWINKHKYPVTIQGIAGRYIVLNLLSPLVTFSNRAVRNGGSTLGAAVDAFTGSPIELEPIRQGLNLYPTYKRALLYDTKIKKWGTCDQDYLALSSLTPWNQSGFQADKDYQNTVQYLDNHQRGLLILGTDGKLWVANDNPTDAYLTVGHYAVHRTRRTKIISGFWEFVDHPDATMDFEPSLDWATIDWARMETKDVKLLRTPVHPNMSAYWFNATLRGRFHLKRGLVKGQTHGR